MKELYERIAIIKERESRQIGADYYHRHYFPALALYKYLGISGIYLADTELCFNELVIMAYCV